MHHAIEPLLKSCLAATDSLPEIRRYGHRLRRLWSACKVRRPDLDLSADDNLVREPDKFEEHPLAGNPLDRGAQSEMCFLNSRIEKAHLHIYRGYR